MFCRALFYATVVENIESLQAVYAGVKLVIKANFTIWNVLST